MRSLLPNNLWCRSLLVWTQTCLNLNQDVCLFGLLEPPLLLLAVPQTNIQAAVVTVNVVLKLYLTCHVVGQGTQSISSSITLADTIPKTCVEWFSLNIENGKANEHNRSEAQNTSMFVFSVRPVHRRHVWRMGVIIMWKQSTPNENKIYFYQKTWSESHSGRLDIQTAWLSDDFWYNSIKMVFFSHLNPQLQKM